ncbi:uncharacterized protein FOMMEDRAFT_156690 [Fomitiporia mediterranea MF3/22]|uniref:uncharacterized protein n=1 Tax=Fomitiporia mediterranea (strain MF3/22) TaxID=694068 RepID=UPI0004408BC5|nr:uncharacterized protein FOMMEDRAFT_156690 [Fomitiporia mediterranea MF3/22]EJD03305.1 hypothetical protein FOMMEDRAFT_156690 [Fomitiporia mediterranea MF3/22]
MPDSLGEVTPAQVVQGIRDANTTRYISAIGLVLLLYNHILSFPDEVEFIWSARSSFAKHVFLLNRYVVSVAQICVAVLMNHFTDDALPNASCQLVITVAFIIGICSIASGNVLVILRVITLWDRDKYIAWLMAIGFCASFTSTAVFAIIVLVNAYSGFMYVPFAHTCVSTIKSPALPGVWASPLIFEVMVLTLVIYNALNRPRGSTTPLHRVLLRDGILFFASLASELFCQFVWVASLLMSSLVAALRTINLIVAIISRPTLVFSGVFFLWSMTTLVLNHSLLNIHKASAKSAHIRLPSRTSYRGHSRQPSDILTPRHTAGAGPVA